MTTRVQIELAETSMNRLRNLKEKTESTSYAEVMKNALRLYEALIIQHDEGGKIFKADKDGNVVELGLFL